MLRSAVCFVACLSVAASSASDFVAAASSSDFAFSEGMGKKEAIAISPTLKPESDKKFFGKDYPGDKRPKVDVLHFKHPYPVVQDNDEFDKDYVKDENSDDGSWMAQTEYDRLRHKLAKEKADVAKALAAKEKGEKELENAIKREKDAKDKKEKAEAKKRETKKVSSEGDKNHREEKVEEKEKPVVKVETRVPGGSSAHGDLDVATKEVEEAMKNLEDCKKELAEAREKLKALMKELEEAKKRQLETQAALDAAIAHAKSLEGNWDEVVKKEHQEYLAAKAAYEKQQALVAKMEADIKEAAAKVKAIRDAEDKNGGVYPTKDSAALPSSISLCAVTFTALMIMAGMP